MPSGGSRTVITTESAVAPHVWVCTADRLKQTSWLPNSTAYGWRSLHWGSEHSSEGGEYPTAPPPLGQRKSLSPPAAVGIGYGASTHGGVNGFPQISSRHGSVCASLSDAALPDAVTIQKNAAVANRTANMKPVRRCLLPMPLNFMIRCTSRPPLSPLGQPPSSRSRVFAFTALTDGTRVPTVVGHSRRDRDEE